MAVLVPLLGLGSSARADTIRFDTSDASTLAIFVPGVSFGPVSALAGSVTLVTSSPDGSGVGVAPGRVTLVSATFDFGTLAGLQTRVDQIGPAIGTLNDALTEIRFAPGQVVLQQGSFVQANAQTGIFRVSNLATAGQASLQNTLLTFVPAGGFTIRVVTVGTEVARAATPPRPVPEPAAAALLLLGIPAAAWLRRVTRTHAG